jgi:hypothetical protein
MNQYISALTEQIHKLEKKDAIDLSNTCSSILNSEQNL